MAEVPVFIFNFTINEREHVSTSIFPETEDVHNCEGITAMGDDIIDFVIHFRQVTSRVIDIVLSYLFFWPPGDVWGTVCLIDRVSATYAKESLSF